MARGDQILAALKYQLSTALAYINTKYSGTAPDVVSTRVYHIEPFDPTKEEDFSPLMGSTNYAAVITKFDNVTDGDYPTDYLKIRFTCDIILIRKTLKVKDRTNDRNLLSFGGTDDAGNTVTSIERLTNALQKWFRTYSQGGKLPNSSAVQTVTSCDIPAVEKLANTGDFYYKVCKFQCLTFESTTISAT